MDEVSQEDFVEKWAAYSPGQERLFVLRQVLGCYRSLTNFFQYDLLIIKFCPDF
jgi:hypothetical protein